MNKENNTFRNHIQFHDKEENLLSKSLKYNINLDFKKSSKETDLINLDVAIRKQDKTLHDQVRYNFVHELRKYFTNSCNSNSIKKTNEDMKLVKTIDEKFNDTPLLLRLIRGTQL